MDNVEVKPISRGTVRVRTIPDGAAGVIAIVLAGICWGFSGNCGQYLFQHADITAPWLVCIRLFVSGIVLTTVALVRERSSVKALVRNKKSVLMMLVFGIFGLLFCQYSYFQTIEYSNSAMATVLQYTGPIMIVVLLCIRKRKLPTIAEGVSVFLAFTGVFILATHFDVTHLAISTRALVWGLVSAIGLLLYTVLPQKLVAEYGSITVTGLGMLIAGVVMCVVVRPWENPVTLDLPVLASLFGVVIIGSVTGYTLYLAGTSRIGPVKSSMIASVEPVSSTVIAFLWLGTRFSFLDILGFACIIVTIFIMAADKKGTCANG